MDDIKDCLILLIAFSVSLAVFNLFLIYNGVYVYIHIPFTMLVRPSIW